MSDEVVAKVETVTTKAEPLALSVATVLYLIFLWYSCNMITRRQVADLLKQIKKDPPSDIAKYLVEEASKAVLQ